MAEERRSLERSARNLAGVSVLIRVAGLNVYDVLRHEKLLLTKAPCSASRQRLGAASGGRSGGVNVHEVISARW